MIETELGLSNRRIVFFLVTFNSFLVALSFSWLLTVLCKTINYSVILMYSYSIMYIPTKYSTRFSWGVIPFLPILQNLRTKI
jgi:hypothetical protein